ncbi:hypothetical protein GCM10009119_04370 [Algoriphagus jejuensis]|uniref:Uncharacterized protein n=1 Tax=Algoriphagus jejuensis TaxID=419934 RepID=A0ABN1MVZ5_9BACT
MEGGKKEPETAGQKARAIKVKVPYLVGKIQSVTNPEKASAYSSELPSLLPANILQDEVDECQYSYKNE